MNGIWFGTIHSYNDLGLILKSKSIPLPDIKTSTIDIPGSNGQIDLTTVLTNGVVKYKNRKLTFVFTMVCPLAEREAKKSEIVNLLHGNIFNITLDADVNYYFNGRCTVSGFTENGRLAEITVTADVSPYKYYVALTVITQTVADSDIIMLSNNAMQVIPSIECSVALESLFEGVRYSLNKGENQIVDIALKKGENQIQFFGAGNVTIKYREGCL